MGDLVLYERQGPIGYITLNRPESANAQNRALSYDLDDAFIAFSKDDEARVGVLRANGRHFSAGHDTVGGMGAPIDRHQVTLWWDHSDPGDPEALLAFEEEVYMGLCRRWREVPKPTIAAVHGACIGGGLSLAWSCDLIVASEDAFFSDPVVSMGCPGIEFFCHPWVLGPRQAKEFLFTGERWGAQRAYEVGMVNRVVPRDQLEQATQELAERFAPELLVEHEEWSMRIVRQLQVDAPARRAGEVAAAAELLELVEANLEPDDLCVERHRRVHVAHADGDVADPPWTHGLATSRQRRP